MNTEKVLVSKELADRRRTKIRQLKDSVVDRKNASEVLPANLCSRGRRFFEEFCEDPENDEFSIHCYPIGPLGGDCSTCREAFFEYVVTLPDREFITSPPSE